MVDQIPDSDPAKKVLQTFNKLYMERFKTPATYYAGQSADGVALIAEGLTIAKSGDPVKVRDALEGIKNGSTPNWVGKIELEKVLNQLW